MWLFEENEKGCEDEKAFSILTKQSENGKSFSVSIFLPKIHATKNMIWDSSLFICVLLKYLDYLMVTLCEFRWSGEVRDAKIQNKLVSHHNYHSFKSLVFYSFSSFHLLSCALYSAKEFGFSLRWWQEKHSWAFPWDLFLEVLSPYKGAVLAFL